MGCKCDGAGNCFWHNTIVNEQQYLACKNGQEPSGEVPCVYLGRESRPDDGGWTHHCSLYGTTRLTPGDEGTLNCQDCKDRATIEDMPEKFVDPLRVTDRKQVPTNVLRNMLCGGSAFLVCGGPSAKQVDFMKLADRGIFSLGVNNVAAFIPVSAFVCSDPPAKFWDGIFKDPKIMKMLPTPKLKGRRSRLRERKSNGEFVKTRIGTAECPNVWGFERRGWLTCDDTWFLDKGAAWGNLDRGVKKTSENKTVCTMLLGLRLLQYLGAKKIFLLGVDFHMDPNRSLLENYSFGEERDRGACRSNNNIYRVVGEWMQRLRPVFEKYGFETFNTYQSSSLRAFDYCPFDDAVEICRSVSPDPPNLTGWYKK